MGQPLQRLAVFLFSDLDAMWKELGIREYDWSASPESRRASSSYPQLNEIQSHVAFDHQCHHDEMVALLQECERAIEIVHTEEGKRAPFVLRSIAVRQHSLGTGLSFRPGVATWPPETSMEPGLPDVPRKSAYRQVRLKFPETPFCGNHWSTVYSRRDYFREDFVVLTPMFTVAPGLGSPLKIEQDGLNSGSAPQDGFALRCYLACFQSEADRGDYTENG
jgi:hypothetical protein